MAPASVRLTSLSLTDFRNHRSPSAWVSHGMCVLTGPNGAGKTNILEAISLLTPGRGLRRAAYEDITRRDTNTGWAVAAEIFRASPEHGPGDDPGARGSGETTRLGTGLAGETGAEGRTRKVRVNGATATAEALLDYLRVLWLTPAMDGLFAGPAGDRRRFLDRLVLTNDPGHARRTRDLDRLLTQRNRLLDENRAAAWLDAVEAQLAENAVAVALARAETVALISVRSAKQAAEQPEFPAGRIALAGEFDTAITGRKAAEAELWYRGALAQNRMADRAAGRTLIGPHRSDLDVVYAVKDVPAALSSTGEQKALLIGIILAHADLVAETSGMSPVLLLDEVAAHLDPARRAALFERLTALGCQTFMSGTDPVLFASLGVGPGGGDAAFFRIAPGRIEPIGPPNPL